MKQIYIVLLLSFSLTAFSQSNDAILKKYADKEEVSQMSLSGDILRMFAKEYEQRELIDKVDKINLLIFSEKSTLDPADLEMIKSNLKKEKYEELINARDGKMNVQILVREKGETIKNLFMLYSDGDTQQIIADMKCSLTYDDLKKLDLDFEGSDGLKFIGKQM